MVKGTLSVVVSAELLKMMSANSSIFHGEKLATKAGCGSELVPNNSLTIRRFGGQKSGRSREDNFF